MVLFDVVRHTWSCHRDCLLSNEINDDSKKSARLGRTWAAPEPPNTNMSEQKSKYILKKEQLKHSVHVSLGFQKIVRFYSINAN